MTEENTDDKFCSDRVQKYFDTLVSNVNDAYEIGNKARAKGLDPSQQVDIKLAKNLAERVVGLISVVAPQIIGTNIVPRIEELEKEYGKLDWRVAFLIALEVAQEKYCKFKDQKEAIEVGIRVGFAYVTVGVVSSPLEGFTDLEIKKTRDGKDYFCLNFAGPIRNAGGTSASVGVLIGDYVRKHMGFAKYDADEKECERCYREVMDYHERVTNLQYKPSKEELIFLTKNIPIEISGSPSEKFEVANFKDLPRVPTNLIRSGFCLINSSCIPLKGPKLWKQLSKWGKEMGMEDWNFLEEFLHIQHESKAGKKPVKSQDKNPVEEEVKEEIVLPDNIKEIIDAKPYVIDPIRTYVQDLVAGRPIFSHPSESGGFRLRYGRSRTSGLSAQSVSSASLSVLDDFVTTATQLKVERPGKAAAFTTCDNLMGPVVLLKNGNVVEVESDTQGNSLTKDVKEILYLGDLLVNYGDFFDRAHELCRPGYCEEWWVQELKREIEGYVVEEIPFEDKVEKIAELVKIDINIFNEIIKKPIETKISSAIALKLSHFFKNLPLHPRYTYFFNQVSFDDFCIALKLLYGCTIREGKLILVNEEKSKRALEIMGIPHFLAGNQLMFDENITRALVDIFDLENTDKKLLNYCLDIQAKQNELIKDKKIEPLGGWTNLFIMNKFSKYIIKDKAGTFVGTRMGRPEKAKMRKMSPPPHTLFPIGEEGGRTKSFQSALETGYVNAAFELFWDEKNGQESILPYNFKTGEMCVKKYWDNKEKVMVDEPDPEKRWIKSSKWMKYDIKSHFKWCLDQMGTRVYPDLIKGVVGTASLDHSVENPIKGILRAKWEIFVNKDGTIRYDGSEVPITHFKPLEVGTPIDKLKEMGYTHDIYNEPLTRDDQILEMFAQDLILPACKESPNEASDDVFFRVTKYIDEELKFLYKMKPYYNLEKPIDLAGHYVIFLAPHTSAGTVGRIVGFSKTQGLFAHPLMHAAIRRDCDGDEGGLFLLMDAFLNFSMKYLNTTRLGATMDAPLVLTSILNPAEVDDMVFNMDQAWNYGLEFYKACEEAKMPWDIKMPLLNDQLGKPGQYEGYGFTHDTPDFNKGVKCSAYKTLPSMKEKLDGQMALAEKIRGADQSDTARIVIEKHFVKDTRGNLRKFSQQTFRCTSCNTIYRRPTLSGRCTTCGKSGLVFTVAEGSIKKYVGYTLDLAAKYNLSPYLQQTLALNKEVIDSIFGKETEKQEGLNKFF